MVIGSFKIEIDKKEELMGFTSMRDHSLLASFVSIFNKETISGFTSASHP